MERDRIDSFDMCVHKTSEKKISVRWVNFSCMSSQPKKKLQLYGKNLQRLVPDHIMGLISVFEHN
jgi:hypothetical protein